MCESNVMPAIAKQRRSINGHIVHSHSISVSSGSTWDTQTWAHLMDTRGRFLLGPSPHASCWTSLPVMIPNRM
jgi:hypothetical protein